MLAKGSPPRVGDVARAFAGAPVVLPFRRIRSPLQPGYLESVERCAAANDCPWCQLILSRTPRATSWIACGPWGPNPSFRAIQEAR